jgi:hypothetical protein
MSAYGFLTLARGVSRSATAVPAQKKCRRGESNEPPGPQLTLPAVRRALQRLLLPGPAISGVRTVERLPTDELT